MNYQAFSVVAVVAQDAAVGVEDLALGDEAEVVALAVDHGQVPRPRSVEFLHYLVHVLTDDDLVGRRGHERRNVHLAV